MLNRCAILALFMALPLLSAAAGFSLTDLQGRPHSLTIHQGKWVLVNLWATWCAPCVAEMPELEALSGSRDDLVILGLAVDGQNAGRVAEFAKKLNVTYPIIAGSPELAQLFRPKGYPTSILYDPNGQQVLVKEGPIVRKEIEEILDRKGIK
ncbi:MAG: TlpA family protein disulfide reductase [Herminiimonas sp.]|nr:TlpA family protein disulfide reductase [Herminiimonas sp.]